MHSPLPPFPIQSVHQYSSLNYYSNESILIRVLSLLYPSIYFPVDLPHQMDNQLDNIPRHPITRANNAIMRMRTLAPIITATWTILSGGVRQSGTNVLSIFIHSCHYSYYYTRFPHAMTTHVYQSHSIYLIYLSFSFSLLSSLPIVTS